VTIEQVTSLIVAITGLAAAIAAILRDLDTRKRLSAHRRTGHAPRADPAASTTRWVTGMSSPPASMLRGVEAVTVSRDPGQQTPDEAQGLDD
jgi:hypothetical protein